MLICLITSSLLVNILISIFTLLHGEKRDWNIVSFLILETYYYISPLVGVFFLALTPIWIIVAAKHPATRTVLHSGWEPVITAMVVSRLVLKSACVCVSYVHVSMSILKQIIARFYFLYQSFYITSSLLSHVIRDISDRNYWNQ